MVLLIDNYDSFAYNLAQYFGELGCDVLVKRNDEILIDEIATLAPQHICISPGPCTPREAGISKDVILAFGARIPMLGVCLGHQCIAEAYGGNVVRASRLMHGKSSTIRHNGEITAESDDGEIMALRHREFAVQGVQFHPESLLTPDGRKILARFLTLAPKPG